MSFMFKSYRKLLALCVAPVVIAGCNDYEFTAPPHTFDIDTQYKGIGLGETLQLNAIGADGNPVQVTWTSDDPNIAKVSATGLVTGVSGGGPVGIIARSVANPNESQAASITVLKGFIKTISGATGSEGVYTIDVPAGATKLTVTIAGGTGDVDMYVRYNAVPTGSGDNCKSEKAGNGESCTITNPQAGKWYVLTYAYEGFAGATLTVLYEN
jgi:hypothetical protein